MSALVPGAAVSPAEVDALLARVSPHASRDVETDAERLARVVWSTLVEPGDGDAGAVVGALGAFESLRLLWTGDPARSAARLAAALADRREAPLSGLSEAVQRWAPRMREASVTAVLRMALVSRAWLITPDDDEWPARLADLDEHMPLVLWGFGDRERLAELHRSAALVGARSATAYGGHVATELSAGLVERGFAVVSGAAYGIDGAAHRAALAAGGLTVAVLAGGIDRFYPAGHQELLARISRDGVVLTEAPLGAPPTSWRFLQRNRIIAALSRASVVVEAASRSGALNTAHHALSLGRPLGAVPGPVTSPMSAGCHQLLRAHQAEPVTSARDVACLAGDPDHSPESKADDPRFVRVLDAMSPRSPRLVDDVARRSGMAIGEVTAVLGLLSLEGRVRQVDGRWVSVRRAKASPGDA